MARLAIRGHETQGKEVIEILEMLGGKTSDRELYGNVPHYGYYIHDNGYISLTHCSLLNNSIIFTLDELLEKFPYKVGDKVLYKYDKKTYFIRKIFWKNDKILYELSDEVYSEGCSVPDTIIFDVDVIKLQPYKEETMEDKGNISDGYHTFNELYEYRLLYNASMFNEFAKQGLYDVHKSKRHSDGTIPFGDGNWFIVQAELPTGQISNHYEMKDWELFDVPEKEKANHYDGHTPQDVTKRLRNFLTPKPKYPKTYEECYDEDNIELHFIYVDKNERDLYESFIKLIRCRNAYWKIAGEQMGLGKPWEPDWTDNYQKKWIINFYQGEINFTTGPNVQFILAFPTEEMRNDFFENFKELIKECINLL